MLTVVDGRHAGWCGAGRVPLRDGKGLPLERRRGRREVCGALTAANNFVAELVAHGTAVFRLSLFWTRLAPRIPLLHRGAAHFTTTLGLLVV